MRDLKKEPIFFTNHEFMINQIATKISLTTNVADLKHFDRGPIRELESMCVRDKEIKRQKDRQTDREIDR